MSHKYACSTEGSTEGEGSIKARAVGIGLHISSKHAVEVCSLLRKKSLGVGIAMLEDVIKERQPVPFRRYKHNVGHRKGVGAGRYPKKACGEIIRLLKAVRSNASVKG
ncbi:50S ribosomal protein L22, partial [Candidatus Woesearchaeota archaeon CG10_big_fil_rev_8_21_14_0_10_47_5]